jgi:hypothetical protein
MRGRSCLLFGFFVPVLMLFIVSCGDAEFADNQEKPNLFPAFDDFPDSLFYGVNFGQTIEETEKDLIPRGYQIKDSSGSMYFYNDSDSTEFILPDKSTLSSFKIFLRSTHYLNHTKELLECFKTSSVSHDLSDEFSVFQYESEVSDFKLSVFSQSDYLRLSFEERVSK